MPPAPPTWNADPWNLDPGRLRATRFAEVRHFDEVASTNAWLLDAARAGAAEGVVAVADHQTAGRGRRGRSWAAAPGTALLVSVLLRPAPALPAERLPLVTMATGLAARDGVERVAGFRPGLKWPNDLVVDDRKLAGLLAEVDGDAVVVGVGLNVAAGAYPPDLAGTATSCQEVAGRPVDRADLLVAFLEALERRYAGLAVGEAAAAAAVVADYRAGSATLGRPVRVELPGRVLEGTAGGLGAHGELLVVDAAGAATEVNAGDVVHLRPRDGRA